MSSFVIIVGWLTILACTIIGIAGMYLFALERMWTAIKRRRSWATVKEAFRVYQQQLKEQDDD